MASKGNSGSGSDQTPGSSNVIKAIGKFIYLSTGDSLNIGFQTYYDSTGNNTPTDYIVASSGVRPDVTLKNDNRSSEQSYSNPLGFLIGAVNIDTKHYYFIQYTILDNNTEGTTTIAPPTTSPIKKKLDNYADPNDGVSIEHPDDDTNIVAFYPTIQVQSSSLVRVNIKEDTGRVKSYDTCCKTKYFIIDDKGKRFKSDKTVNLEKYKKCDKIKFTYLPLTLLGFCKCLIHIEHITCIPSKSHKDGKCCKSTSNVPVMMSTKKSDSSANDFSSSEN